MKYEITGDNLQIVTIHLGEGEMVYAEAGAMNHMSANMRMEAKMKGGLLGGIKRKFSGESLFLTEFTTTGSSGYVAFAGNVPGRIKPIELHGTEFFAQKDAFIHACGDFVEMDLAEGETVKVDTGSVVGFDATVGYDITRAGGIKTSLFGGEGLFLTALTGPGHIIIQSMNIANLASALRPFMPVSTSGRSSGSGGLGGLIGD